MKPCSHSSTLINVRIASLDDVRGITNVHCSDITEWYKWIGNKQATAKYEELSISERFLHGGPWMSVETCAIHINYLLTSGQYPLVAEYNGKIVGELELIIGPEKGVLNKTGFIDILVVHRNFRRRGIGTFLVNRAIEIAKEKKCNTLSVWPEKRAIPFYEKCGFRKIAYRIVHVLIHLNKLDGFKKKVKHKIEGFPNEYDELKNWTFICPRILSSFTAWLKSKWLIAVESAKVKLKEGVIGSLEAAFIIEKLWRRNEASISLWIREDNNLTEALESLFTICKQLMIERIHMYLSREYIPILQKFPIEVRGEEVLLMMEI